jgi:hypothetical protein
MPTLTKSYRLDEKLLHDLSVVARKYNHTENQLVANWLLWRIRIDPLVPTFEGISIDSEMFRSILSTADVDSLDLIGWEFGKKHFTKARALFEASDEKISFVRYISEVLCYHGHWFSIEGESSESSLAMTLHHNFTWKWTNFLSSYLTSAYQVVSKKKLYVETVNGFLKVKIPEREVVP